MEELTTRPYRGADAAAVAELLNLIAEHAGGYRWATADRVAAYLATEVRDLERDSRLVVAADGALVAMALVSAPPEDGWHIDLNGGVHPGWRGHGLGRRLLEWQLDRASERHRLLAPEARWEAHTGIQADDESAIRLFRRFGFSPVRYWNSMVADPTRPVPASPLPDGLRVAVYTRADEALVHAAHTDAFADHWGFQVQELAEWAAARVRSERFLPELSRLGFDQDQVAGYVLCYRSPRPETLYIGQVGVRAGWRRRGLAGALLADVLGAAGATDWRWVQLNVDAGGSTGAVGLYERVGFTVESRSVTYAVGIPPATTPA